MRSIIFIAFISLLLISCSASTGIDKEADKSFKILTGRLCGESKNQIKNVHVTYKSDSIKITIFDLNVNDKTETLQHLYEITQSGKRFHAIKDGQNVVEMAKQACLKDASKPEWKQEKLNFDDMVKGLVMVYAAVYGEEFNHKNN